MDAATAQVLLDVANFTLGAMVLGLVVFAFVRRRDSEVGWHYHGNVWTEPFDRLDLATAILLMLYFYAMAATPGLFPAGSAEAGEEVAKVEPAALVTLDLVFKVALGAGLFAYVSVLRGRDPVQLFGLGRLSAWAVLGWAAAAMVPVYLSIAAVEVAIWRPFFDEAWGERGLQQAVKILQEGEGIALPALVATSAIVVAPLFEELAFRGVIYTSLKRYSDRFFAAVVTSLMFAAVHGSVPLLLPLFALALLLTTAYELTGCLWVPIAMHAIFNAINTAYILSGPGG